MSEPAADVAVVGLGAWGSSALWQLARRGVRVLGIERYGRGHSLGASHGGSRMFRVTCLEHSGLVPLARRSLDLWRHLERESGQRLLLDCGGLLIGAPDSQVVAGTLAAARQHAIEVAVLGRDELVRRYPQHAGLAPGDIGVWEPSAKLIRPEAAVRAALDLAEAAGATVFTDTRVTGIEPDPEGVWLHTPTRSLRVGRVVVTVGSWLPSLVPVPALRVARMPVTWFRPLPGALPYALEQFPVFMRQIGENTVLWGCGSEGPYDIKLGLEQFGGTAVALDPDSSDRSVDSADWNELCGYLPTFLPGLEAAPSRVAVCMLTLSPDGQFVVGALPHAPNVIVAGGDNAHGFKHATGLGEALADLAVGASPRVDLSFTDVKRYL
ncbi:N-methyl-L-tryptophan oxidase [Streptomyces silvisoli]|uniref:N-methyl-L-tryptophan oxidase n=1 Tax=Streptomyces silvisoli TaxID=3034235 RepID=A0ABT5ZKZ1_9ACTN|nr:N-methyl-L-tryptophan oxidase [Streptomyces silvisoli]MDF3290502.1 N-methyl-L-tryptophan oxidase [Streptomyces silvisoli]